MMIEITITEEDMDEAKPGADSCPIALAANRALKVPCQVYYSFYGDRKKGWILSNLGDKKYGVVRLPTGVAVWAEVWDRTGKGKTFTFTLEKRK
jgi:hypothetical protein